MSKFSVKTIEYLKYYVYQLRNSMTKEVFYVGKGNGNRVFEHVKHHNKPIKDFSPKDEVIKNILSKGNKVIEEIIAYDLTEREAMVIEASIIKSYTLEKLTNKKHGYQGNVPINANEIEFSIAKPIQKFNYNVLFLKINQLWKNSSTEEELHDALRGYWKLNKDKFSKLDFIIGVTNGIARVIVKAKENKLYEAGLPKNLKNAPRKDEFYKEKFKRKLYFIIEKAPEEVIKKYLNKNFILFVESYRSSKRYFFPNI